MLVKSFDAEYSGSSRFAGASHIGTPTYSVALHSHPNCCVLCVDAQVVSSRSLYDSNFLSVNFRPHATCVTGLKCGVGLQIERCSSWCALWHFGDLPSHTHVSFTSTPHCFADATHAVDHELAVMAPLHASLVPVLCALAASRSRLGRHQRLLRPELRTRRGR